MERKSLKDILSFEEVKRIIKKFEKVKIGVIGDVMLDKYIWGQVKRISPEAPVPVVEILKEDYSLGGAGNVAKNIKSLGGNVVLCGCKGNDENGKILSELLEKWEIENYLFERDSYPTITKTRIIAKTQQLLRVDRERRLPFSDIQDVKRLIKEKFFSCDGFIISDYGKGFITGEIIKFLQKFAEKNKKIIVVDPKVEHFLFYKKVTCLTPNKYEASAGMYSKEVNSIGETIELGKKIIKKLKCENLMITLGKDGMVVFEKSGNGYHIPAVAKEVYDVTGAGDTVVSSLTLSLATGIDILSASIISNFAAGVVVGKLGTASLTREELKDIFKKNYKSQFIEIFKWKE